jgi:ATP-binding cassette subfamily B (MDR/TAP) protein 1
MFEEMKSLRKNETRDLVKLYIGIKHVCIKFLLLKTMIVAGHVKKFKARLVVKGYYQVEGVDFGDMFSLVAKLTSNRVLMCLVVAFDI